MEQHELRIYQGGILLGRVQARFTLLMLACCLAGCRTNSISESQRFEASVKKELPFRIDSLRWFDGVDMATYQFASQDYIQTLPDAEIGMNGELFVYRTFDNQNAIPTDAPIPADAPTRSLSRSLSRQTEDKVWEIIDLGNNVQP